MYTRFYQLSKKPFEISTDPRFLWLGEKHKEGLAILRYALMDEKGFLLLTGDVGTGKTTLINALLQDIGDNVRVANVTIPNLDPMGFFNHIARAFLIPQQFDRKEDFLQAFKAFLEQTRLHKNQRVVLIIDEAHTLSKEMLEEVRLLSNIELPEKKLINIFLVGQNEINPLLMSPECRPLRQRITINYNIKNLSVAETQQYIAHRLKVAGTEARLFTQEAIDRIQRFSRGYPRLINIICDLALVTGYARNLKKITPAVILECARETLLPGEVKEDLFLDDSPFTMGPAAAGHPPISRERDAATAAGSAVNVLEKSRKPAETRPDIRPTRSRQAVRHPVVPVKRRWMLALPVIFSVFIGAAFFWMPPEDWSSWLTSKAPTAPATKPVRTDARPEPVPMPEPVPTPEPVSTPESGALKPPLPPASESVLPEGRPPTAVLPESAPSKSPLPSEPAPVFYVHNVQWPGEMLSIIALWYTGAPGNWKAIANANPAMDPDVVSPGDKILIPAALLKTRKPMPRRFVSAVTP